MTDRIGDTSCLKLCLACGKHIHFTEKWCEDCDKAEVAAGEYAEGNGTTDCPEVFLENAFLFGIAWEREQSKVLIEALEEIAKPNPDGTLTASAVIAKHALYKIAREALNDSTRSY